MSPAHGNSAYRFVVLFVVLACVMLGAYYFPYAQGTLMRRGLDEYLRGYATIAGSVLGWFDSAVQVRGQDIVGRYSLRIVRTCDAADVKILFASAVLAWPTSWRRRIAGVALGVSLILVLNVARICTLYYVGVHWPAYFKFAHHELLPVIILAGAVGAFTLFTVAAGVKPGKLKPHVVV